MRSNCNHRFLFPVLVVALSSPGCWHDEVDAEDTNTAQLDALVTGHPPGEPGAINYRYDGSGSLVARSLTPPVDGVETIYTLGPHLNIVQKEGGALEMERYVLINGKRVIYMPDGAGGEVYHLHNDHLGSPKWMTSSAGTYASRYRYEPFGRPTDRGSSLRYQHGGEEVSARLTHLGGVRQYNNAIGRMMQPDIIQPDLFNPQSLNRYSYVYNDPLHYTDPSGYKPGYRGPPRVIIHTRKIAAPTPSFRAPSEVAYTIVSAIAPEGAVVATLIVDSAVAGLVDHEVRPTVEEVSEAWENDDYVTAALLFLKRHTYEPPGAVCGMAPVMPGSVGARVGVQGATRALQLTGRAVPRGRRLLPGIRFVSKTLGHKVGQHGPDWGLNPAKAVDRANFRSIVRRVVHKAQDIRQGSWHPKTPAGGNDFLFYQHRGSVVVTQPDGTFVTIMRDALKNNWFTRATQL